MALGILLTVMLVLSLFSAAITGNMAAVSAAALSGAGDAVTLLISLGGALCLWSGIMEWLRCCGAADALSRGLRPLLRWLLPYASRDQETLSALAANLSANLLGLGNAATPPGLKAARRMAKASGRADDELCRLVVLNSCSLQLLPTTVAALRAANGAAAPFDILSAVWLASLVSIFAGLAAAKIFSLLWRD